MLQDGHVYTREELDALTIHDLRIVLSKIGGVPKLKNRQVLIDEIIQIQDGTLVPVRSTRGRKPKFIKIEEMERRNEDARRRAQEGEEDNVPDIDQIRGPAPGMVRFLAEAGCYDNRKGYQEKRDNSERRDYTDKRSYSERRDYTEKRDESQNERKTDGQSFYGKRADERRGAEAADGGLSVADSDTASFKTVPAQGVLEIMESGYGFLRTYDCHYDYPDFYVDRQILRRYGLKTGDYVTGFAINKFDKSSLNVREVTTINGIPVAEFKRGRYFDDYPAIYPDERFVLSAGTKDFTLRAIDMVAPIGKGQRGLIVAPPKTGKTTLLKKIASSIEKNYPDAYLIVLLIDERPEEVTDFAELVVKGEVVASTFDESPEKHVKFAEIYLERAKRLAECGKDVVVLLDSVTKLTRAYNNVIPSSGKTLSGGIDPQALLSPKKFFGAARNLKGGASLTVISTALIETGSRMDDVIFEEFKGTGNMEIVLSRHLSERRIFPAIDLLKSGTRNEEYLFGKDRIENVYKLRRFLAQEDAPSEAFLEMVQKTSDNDDLLSRLDTWIKVFGTKK